MATPNSGAVGEDDLVPISALLHMLYCPRRCALIHIERQWSENRFTAEGRILHERTDAGGRERRSGMIIERSVPLRSLRLGVSGIADVVEIHGDSRPFPIEYKSGRPDGHRADEVQLCAQAMCLEEMLDRPVPEGALFYGRSRRRKAVVFDAELRTLTERVVADTRSLLAAGDTPLPQFEARKCGACSLKEVCQPQRPSRSVRRWLAQAVAPFTGARIETTDPRALKDVALSPPSRGRGLKPHRPLVGAQSFESPPSRGRGLKRHGPGPLAASTFGISVPQRVLVRPVGVVGAQVPDRGGERVGHDVRDVAAGQGVQERFEIPLLGLRQAERADQR